MKLVPRRLSWLIVGLLVGGCVEPLPTLPVEEPTSALELEPRASGPALWLEGQLQEGHATIEVWAGNLGEVFGYSLHLTYDREHLRALPEEEGDLNQLVLGAGRAAPPIYLRREGPDAVILGAVRYGVAEGEHPVMNPVRVATARLKVLKDGTSSLRLEKTMVRRSNGAFTATQATGARLVTTGGAR